MQFTIASYSCSQRAWTRLFGLNLVIAGLLVVGCDTAKPKSEKVAPAKVEMVPHETELATLTLTRDAVRRLGITTSATERRQVARHRTLTGEAIVPSAKSIITSTPVSGIIFAVGDRFPVLGSKVADAQPLLILKPMLSPERDVPTPAEQVQMTSAKANLMTALVAAEGEVSRSESEIEGLMIARDRAQKLLADRAGSQRAFDDVDAQVNIARTVLAAAQQRQKELAALLGSIDQANKDGTAEPASPLTLTAPISGIIRSINVSEGQTVTPGAPLFEVVNLDTIWIRVPVYVDLLASLKLDQSANLVELGGKSLGSRNAEAPINTNPVIAKPIMAPPTADAASSSADLYYEVDNRQLGLRPGQRVGIDVPMNSVTEALIVPSASLLYDIYGGTWVYLDVPSETDETSKYVRHRVLLEWVDGDDAVLSQGPTVGTMVVVDGAAELFGTEFGAGK